MDEQEHEILNMDDPDFVEKLGAAIGLKPGEGVHFVTPQFTRTDGLQVPKPLMDFSKSPRYGR